MLAGAKACGPNHLRTDERWRRTAEKVAAWRKCLTAQLADLQAAAACFGRDACVPILKTREPRVTALGKHRNPIGRQARDGQRLSGHSPLCVVLNGTAVEGDVTGGGDTGIEKISNRYSA